MVMKNAVVGGVGPALTVSVLAPVVKALARVHVLV